MQCGMCGLWEDDAEDICSMCNGCEDCCPGHEHDEDVHEEDD